MGLDHDRAYGSILDGFIRKEKRRSSNTYLNKKRLQLRSYSPGRLEIKNKALHVPKLSQLIERRCSVPLGTPTRKPDEVVTRVRDGRFERPEYMKIKMPSGSPTVVLSQPIWIYGSCIAGEPGKAIQEWFSAAETELRRIVLDLENLPENLDERLTRTRSYLSVVLRCQGKFAEAETHEQRVLDARIERNGVEHRDTLRSMSNLAVLLCYQRKYSVAEPLHRQALAGNEKLLGPEHPQTLACLHNLALLCLNQRKYEEARETMSRALAGSRVALNPQHPHLLATIVSMAWIQHCQSRHHEALTMHRESYKCMFECLGPDHPATQAFCALESLASKGLDANPGYLDTSGAYND